MNKKRQLFLLVAAVFLFPLSFVTSWGQPAPPPQPESGPGGSDYLHAAVTAHGPFYASGHDGDLAYRYFLYEPAVPTPATAPVVLFLHGLGATDPLIYQAWIDHMVKKGYTVAWVQYQSGGPPTAVSDLAVAGETWKDALARLSSEPGHVLPELDPGGALKTGIVGHSLGGYMASVLAARTISGGLEVPEGLPVPLAVVAIEPGGRGLLTPGRLEEMHPDTKLVVVVGDDDTLVCTETANTIWERTAQIPDANRDYLLAVSDSRGDPPQVSNHLFPTTVPVESPVPLPILGNESSAMDARDFFITWKLSVAALNCAMRGEDCEVAVGDGSDAQVDMGQWEDGIEMEKLVWVEDPTNYVASCDRLPPTPDDTDADYPLQFTEIAPQGFGDEFNSKAWSMIWWKGKLYVGTARAHYCVQTAALALEGVPGFTYPPYDRELACTLRVEDLPLRGEIWSYDPVLEHWERVYQSAENVPIPGAPGKFTGRDAGFRNIVAFTDPDGTEALYAFGVTTESIFNFEAAGWRMPPRILRSEDGQTWLPVPQDPGTVLGDLGRGTANFRAAAVFRGRLFVVAADLRGGGRLMEASDPAGGNDNFQFVAPEEFKIYEMAVFQDQLYVGTDSLSLGAGAPEGFAVARTEASGSPPYAFTTVVEKGAYKDPFPSNSAVSLHVFDACGSAESSLASGSQCGPMLYVGTDKPAELIRIRPDDSWELVVGAPREQTPLGPKEPLSGYAGGFDDPLNEHIWRMADHEGRLLVGTNDMRGFLKGYRIFEGALGLEYMGLDLAASRDGADFKILTRTGYGGSVHSPSGLVDISRQLDIGVRVFASTPYGVFFGTSNTFDGLRIYKSMQTAADVDGDGKVDRNDVNLILSGRGVRAQGVSDRRDLDGDGIISVRDARMGVLQCSKTGGCEP